MTSAATPGVLLKKHPLVDTWITEKLQALFIYVIMDTLALRFVSNTIIRGHRFGRCVRLNWYTGKIAVSQHPILL